MYTGLHLLCLRMAIVQEFMGKESTGLFGERG